MKKTLTSLVCIALVIGIVCAMSFALVGCDNGNDSGKVVTVGYTVYEPMNYLDANNNLVGFDTDLAKEVFGLMGYTVIFKEINWDNKYVDLNSGTIDCIWNGFTANSADDDGVQRADKVDFSFNYMLNAQCVVIQASDAETLNSVAAFSGLTGYVEAGSAGEAYAKDTFTASTISTATKQTDALLQVKSKAAKFAVLDYQLANSLVGKGNYSDLAIVSTLTSESEYYAIGFKKGSELTEKVNVVLAGLGVSGKIMELATTYGVAGSVITDYSSQYTA